MNNQVIVCIASMFATMLMGFSTVAAEPNGDGDPPQIPSLAWTQRSDWTSVKDHGAIGDGKADDTVALQKVFDTALDKEGERNKGSVIYLPPGTYRVTKNIRLTGPMTGVSVIGHDRDTTLVWDGEEGGKLFTDDGVAYCRYIGIQFDGKNKAAIGFHHESLVRFETEVRHQHLAFRNFTEAGILVEPNDNYALAETECNNCLFEDCKRGVSFTSFNDYNYTFDGCEFRRCNIGIECAHGNFFARNCHFEGSREVDVDSRPEHGCSVRRCTSSGSQAFVRHNNSVSPLTIQDCHVDGWKNPDGAVLLSGAPVVLFDCVFTNGPEGKAPVNRSSDAQRLVVSENRAPNAPSVIVPGSEEHIYEIPAGNRQGNLTSAHQRFVKSEARVPGKVFDARREFGALGDGVADDTAAIQKAIDAARNHGQGAIAYLPSGNYNITDTLHVTGSNYYVGGNGVSCTLTWRGPQDGTLMHVHDPQNITLEHFAPGNHLPGETENAIDVLQTSSGIPTRITYDGVYAFGMYQKRPLVKGTHLRGLGKNDVVVAHHIQGNLRLIESAQATVMFNCSYEGSIVVEGEQRQGDGFLGFMTRLATITTHGLYLRDNQNIVMTDFYVEQANDGIVLEGKAGQSPGRATIQGANVDFQPPGEGHGGTVIDSRNYAGQVFFGPNQFYATLPRVPAQHAGDAKLDLFMWANCFYQTHLEVEKNPSFHVHLLANAGVAIEGKNKVLDHENRAEDNLPEGEFGRLSPALDDLRRLGALDLQLNHHVEK